VIFQPDEVLVRLPPLRWSAAAAAGAALALAIPALAGCSAASAGSAAAPEKTSITVDVFPTIDFAGLYIAQMDKLFQKQGLHVSLIFAPASQLAVTSVLNGSSDISGSDYVTYIDNELDDDAGLRIIAEGSSLEPNELGLFTGPHSPITRLAGLNGHTVGVTSADDIDTLLVRALLAENGVGSSSVNIQFGFQLSNVAGEVAADKPNVAAIPEPFASEGEQQYGLQELADVDQGVTTNFPLEGYAVTAAWARRYPRTLAAFDRALEQGQEIADTDRTAFEAAIEKYLVITRETAAVISQPDYPLTVTPVQLQRVVDAMVQFGMLPPKDLSFKVTTMTG
jgi:NitT/TauT family transport system substrate-binding protein